MVTVLGQNQYGKAEVRIVRVSRDTVPHRVKDLTVGIALSGDLAATHLTGDNSAVLPTDTAKNTVYALARQHGIACIEEYGGLLARHFVDTQPAIHRARVRIEEYGWSPIASPAFPHSFVRDGGEVRTTEVVRDGSGLRIVSGVTGLIVMNTTASEFRGYVKDRYTTLRETSDRVLATEVNARWHLVAGGDGMSADDFDTSYTRTRRHLLDAFAQTYSLSLQQTLYAMGHHVLENHPETDEIRLSMPNKHHFLVDLEPFGQKNDNEVYFAADRPYGLIEGTVHREGVTPVIPVD